MYEYRNPYILDFTNIQYYGDVHQIIKEAFDFPDYYGENWDAFWDCITDMVDEEKFNIQILGYGTLKNKYPEDAKIMTELLEDMRHFNNDKYIKNVSVVYVN